MDTCRPDIGPMACFSSPPSSVDFGKPGQKARAKVSPCHENAQAEARDSKNRPMIPALFVTHRHSLHGPLGGQQTCTQEYWRVLTSAGFLLKEISYETPADLKTKIWRKARPHPYRYQYPGDLAERITYSAETTSPKIIFLNLKDTVPLAAELRHLKIPLVLLSHGLASVDQLHENRISGMPWPASSARRMIQELQSESQGMPFFSHVFCLSEIEVAIARWMGACSAGWLPRVIEPEFLEVRPSGDRLGCIGTMDHPPNLEGMELFLKSLQAIRIWSGKVRLISRSDRICRKWALDYPFVDYLGSLDEAQAKEEASSWNAFLHPIFCYAMGCSTKLATGLRWGLPIVTSEAGARGYRLDSKLLSLTNNPVEMAEYSVSLLEAKGYQQALDNARRCAKQGPSIAEVAQVAHAQLQPLLQHV